jgi:hypothetical protein
VSWTARSTWAIPVAIGVVVLGVVLTAAVRAPIPGLICLLAAVVVLHFRHITVTVDETHLRTRFAGPLVRVSIPLAEIERLEYVPDLRPVRYGGWGYRGSLRLLKRAAVILRRGEGVIFALTGERRFIITVDEAESLATTVLQRIGGS